MRLTEHDNNATIETSVINLTDRELFKAIPGAVVMFDERGIILMSNAGCQDMFGYANTELVGEKVEKLVPNSLQPRNIKHLIQLYLQPENPVGLIMDLIAVHKDATRIPVEISLTLFKDRKRTILLGFITDITQRKKTEQALREERSFVNKILETVGALIIVLDQHGRITRFNQAGEDLLGYTTGEIKGAYLWDLPFVSGDPQPIKDTFNNIKAGDFPGKYENAWVTRDGKKKVISWAYTVVTDENNEVNCVIGAGIDITELRQLEADQINAVITVQEKERKRLASELHDGLGVLLSTAKINLSVLEPNILKLDEEKRKNFENANTLIDSSMKEIRTMAANLLPPVLEDYGLEIAIRALCEKISETQNINVRFFPVLLNGRLDVSIEICLYRIAQELTNNALKYANADKVTIQLIRHESSILLMVEDSGKGFDPAVAMKNNHGFGLKGITSRVKSLGGNFKIDSNPNQGTLATVEIPLKN